MNGCKKNKMNKVGLDVVVSVECVPFRQNVMSVIARTPTRSSLSADWRAHYFNNNLEKPVVGDIQQSHV